MTLNRRWTHKIPGVPDRRVNTILVTSLSKTWRTGDIQVVAKAGPRVFVDGPIQFADPDWTIRGQGIVLAQYVDENRSRTEVTFLVLWVYPFWLRWILTWVNAHAQGRAQNWALEHAPNMLMTDRE